MHKGCLATSSWPPLRRRGGPLARSSTCSSAVGAWPGSRWVLTGGPGATSRGHIRSQRVCQHTLCQRSLVDSSSCICSHFQVNRHTACLRAYHCPCAHSRRVSSSQSSACWPGNGAVNASAAVATQQASTWQLAESETKLVIDTLRHLAHERWATAGACRGDGPEGVQCCPMSGARISQVTGSAQHRRACCQKGPSLSGAGASWGETAPFRGAAGAASVAASPLTWLLAGSDACTQQSE